MHFNLFGRTNRSKFITIITILSITWVIIWLKKKNTTSSNEGFSQETAFILKSGDDAFDEFYAQIHNVIHPSIPFVESISNSIVEHPSFEHDKSLMLIIASDTGEQSNSLMNKGVDIYSLFKHKEMFEQSKILYTNLKVKFDDFNNPMTYDKSTFSHILCLRNLIYTVKDKSYLLRNIYNWLIPGGIVFVQLSERSKFNTIKSSFHKDGFIDSPQKYHTERITDSEIDYGSFKYSSSYDFTDAEMKDLVYFSEVFEDAQTKYVRKNEHTLYMENIEDILKIAEKCGFFLLNKISIIEDDNQFIYTFERRH